MPITTDLSTDIGKVRLLIADTTDGSELYSDPEVQAFLDFEGGHPKKAAALALETAASQSARLLRATKILDLSVDGTKAAETLRKMAKELRAQAAEVDASGAVDVGFRIAENPSDPILEHRVYGRQNNL